MSDKRYDQFTYAMPDEARIFLHADPATGALRKAPVSDYLNLIPPVDPILKQLQQFGSPILCTLLNLPIYSSSIDASLTSDRLVYTMCIAPLATITGIWYLPTGFQGAFTANNYNGFALYSESSGTLTKIAETANDANIWKQTTGTFIQVAFNSPVTLTSSVVWIGFTYSGTAVVHPPTLRSYGGGIYSGNSNLGMSLSRQTQFYNTSSTGFPSSISPIAGFAYNTATPLCGLY